MCWFRSERFPTDFNPVKNLLLEIDESEIDAVDILHRSSSCFMNVEYVLSLLHAVNQKLRVVVLQDMSFGKDLLLDISQRGLSCQVLNLRSSHFRKLNMIGKFDHMQTLNLDFSASLNSFQESCFTCMPNLKCLSLCETRISNLWTTSAALAKLPSLIELRFQNSLCWDDTAGSYGSSNRNAEYSNSGQVYNNELHLGPPSGEGSRETMNQYSNAAGELVNLLQFHSNNVNHETPSTLGDSSDDSEVDFSNQHWDFSLVNLFSDLLPGWNGSVDQQIEAYIGSWGMQSEEESLISSSDLRDISFAAPKKYIANHPSPICYEKHYREYMIASLPNLRVLDNLPIRKIDKDRADIIFSETFEYLPYKRSNKESLVSILHKREIKASGYCVPTSRQKPSYTSGKSQKFYSRSLCAAKVGSSSWPLLRPLSLLKGISTDDRRKFRPRQFEYHPSNSSLTVFGTLDGEVVVVNHESKKIVSYIPSLGAMNSVLGLCWLKKYPSKVCYKLQPVFLR